MTAPYRVELEVDEHGIGSLRVNGLELAPMVARAVVTLVAGALPQVTLAIVPGSVVVNTMGELELVEDPRA